MRYRTCPIAVVWGLIGCSLLSVASAQAPAGNSAESWFQRGFYLQVHEHDLAGARAAYEKAAADPAASEALRAQATLRARQVREDQAAANFAALMPADCMAYAEITEPGAHIERILKMMDLLGPKSSGGDSGARPLVIDRGIAIPPDFTVSPALVAELKKIRGVAAGLTSLDQRGRPAGLAVIHPGDCDLVRGLIETGIQLLERGDPIEGFNTYRIPDFGWVMLTARMVLVSDSRDELTAAVGRLRNPSQSSLAQSAAYQRAMSESAGSLAFVFVDGPQVLKRYGSLLNDRQAALIRTLADLDHLESLVVALTTSDEGIQLRAQLNLMEGHRNMLYALVRTAPITRRSLARVPQGAAGVLVVGLNPPAAPSTPETPSATPPAISGMDIGREFFHNIEELSVFALPPSGGEPGGRKLPEFAAVIAVKDPAKSEALWNQLLTIAALVGARQPKPPEAVTIGGSSGQVYHFDGLPPVAVIRTQRELVLGTQGAVAASLGIGAGSGTIADDPAFATLLGRLTPTTSKALLIDAGRTLETVAAISGGRDASELRMAGSLARDLKFSLVTDEAPNQLTIRANLTGLPKFAHILSVLNEAQQGSKSAAK